MQASGWLIDVYETVLRVDLRPIGAELAAIADIPLDLFGLAIRPFGQQLTIGRVSWAEVFSAVLRECGREASSALVGELVVAHDRMLVEHAEVFDDGLDLLVRLREAGIGTALVSNCAPHTRSMLESLGLDRQVDHMVLSCEVGAAKPDPPIFRAALDLLEVSAGDAVLVDDQPSFCAGAVALGMQALQVQRGPDPTPDAETSTWPRVADLRQVRLDAPSTPA